MASISSTGFGSGLPINDLVSQLVEAESKPALNRLDRREASLQTELSSIGLLKSALSDFQSSLGQLRNPDSFNNRSAMSSNESVATLTADQSANIGSYSLEVDRLASAQKLVSQQNYNAGDTGSLSFTNQAGASFTVDINAQDATLEGIRDTINGAADNFGVTATILNLSSGPKLVLTANETGEANRITSINSASTSGDLSVFDYNFDPAQNGNDTNFDQVTAAEDALLRIEGQQITSSNNTLDGVIPGVEFTLTGTTQTGLPISLNIESNIDDVSENIQNFVTAYNDLRKLIAEETRVDPASGKAGNLLSDSLTRTVQNQLRDILSSSGSKSGNISALVDLGITTNRDGTLDVNSVRLNSALRLNFDNVTEFFSGEQGMANRLNDTLNVYLQRSGTFDSRTESINQQIRSLDSERETVARRMSALEARMFAQFNAMDSIVAQLNNTGSFLTQQLENISQISAPRSKR